MQLGAPGASGRVVKADRRLALPFLVNRLQDKPRPARVTTPLHLASLNCHVPTVKLLLAADVSAAGVRDHMDRLPVDRCSDRRKPGDDLLAALVSAHHGGLHAAVECDGLADLVHSIVQKDPSVAYTAKDLKGRPAINLAAGRCRARMLEALFFLGRYELLNRDNPKHRSASCVVLFARDFGGGGDSAEPAAANGGKKRGRIGGAGGAGAEVGTELALKLMKNR